MSNPWFRDLVSQKKCVPPPVAQTCTFYPRDIKEEDESFIYLYREKETDGLTTDYSVRLIGDRKVYERGETKLVTWSRAQCEKRIADLFSSGGSVTDFWKRAYLWVTEQPDEMHAKWADDCNKLLEIVYEETIAKQEKNATTDLLGPLDLLGDVA